MGGVMTGGVSVGGAMVYGAAACAYVCGAPSGLAVAVSGGLLCFGDGAQVHLPGGNLMPVERLAAGNATYAMNMDASLSSTIAKVVYAKREKGSFASRTFVYGPDANKITVTDNHLMILNINGTVQMREAKDVTVGDVFVPAAEYHGAMQHHKVLSVESGTIAARNLIATTHGTISVNGLAVSAMCDAPTEGVDHAAAFADLVKMHTAAEIVQLWKAGHVNNAVIV